MAGEGKAGWIPVTTSPDVVRSDLIDGGILFDLDTKQYFALNPSALLVWELLERGADLASLEASLRARFGEGEGPDPFGLRRFVEYLVDQELAVPAAAASPAGGDGNVELPSCWEPPRAECHGSPLAEVVLSPFDPTVPIPE